MSKRNWDKARRRNERQEDWRYRKLGAMTDKRSRFLAAQQRRLKAEFLERARQPRPDGHVQPRGGAS